MRYKEQNRRISEGLRLAWKRRKGKAMKFRKKPVEIEASQWFPPGDLRHHESIVTVSAGPSPGPQTHEEARQFHEGFLSGATAYAKAVGHSTLKRDNPKLCEVFDAQGWRTIETFEKLNHVCEHGVKDGDWCEPCNKEMKASAASME